MVRFECQTLDQKTFNILYNPKKFSVIGFEYEQGVDVEKLRSLQAFNFSTKAQLKETIKRMIPCKILN